MTTGDPFDLERFVAAQHGVHERAIAELRSGRKASHWMWFVLPQLRGLGRSELAWRYGISCLEEARAYLRHPVLGPRLHECVTVLEAADPRLAARDVFGHPDDLKLHSSLTLFSRAAGPGSIFERLLARFFDGRGDPLTLARLQAARTGSGAAPGQA